MAENESFFRKVVRFVANPTTDWHELTTRQEDTREIELEKSELKAMVERKRRNDFVRRREFDMLRRLRREGLSPEQLAALGGSSRLDDSDNRSSEATLSRQDGVKAKIDAIEQQMVGDAGFSANRHLDTVPGRLRRAPVDPQAPTAPAAFAGDAQPSTRPARATAPATFALSDVPRDAAGRPLAPAASTSPGVDLPLTLSPDLPAVQASQAVPAQAQFSMGLPPLAPTSQAVSISPGARGLGFGDTGDYRSDFAVEVSEIVHDPELDEAVIAFANADFAGSEASLRRLTQAGGGRLDHAETWLTLFDLYRATGQQAAFDHLAGDYAERFGWSAPQWYSLPRQVADAQQEVVTRSNASTEELGLAGWTSPSHLDREAVDTLASQVLQLPLPWVLDWRSVQRIDAEAATALMALFRRWGSSPVEMRWTGGDRLLATLNEEAPNGVRDADPAFWLARLEALRLVNRVDHFDEAAIEYCLTYEVSPPSWEPARCHVVVGSGSGTTRAPSGLPGDAPSSFLESSLLDEATGVARLDLAGQLVGDIGPTLTQLGANMGRASHIEISCSRLIRVDFIAAGDLLNWVLSRRSENRTVQFVELHRLVALFFGAMGINEHAKVQVRKV